MKLDYAFLKDILKALEERQSSLCANTELAQAVFIDQKNDEQLDKFSGHLNILNDIGCVDCNVPDLGYHLNLNSGGFWTIHVANIRLTNVGYEFLDILNEDTVFNKVKKFAASTALEIGKPLLIAALTKGLSP